MTTITPCTQMALLFKSNAEMIAFKNASGCTDFYIDKDYITLVGMFTERNLLLATSKYHAMVSMDRNVYS